MKKKKPNQITLLQENVDVYDLAGKKIGHGYVYYLGNGSFDSILFDNNDIELLPDLYDLRTTGVREIVVAPFREQ